MEEETYSSEDRIRETEFGASKADGVVGIVFVKANGQRIKALLSRDTIPAFIEKLQAQYRTILD